MVRGVDVQLVWINLAQSKIRAGHMEAHLRAAEMRAQRFEAVDGRRPLNPEMGQRFSRYRAFSRSITPTEGCALSHLSVLEHVRSQGGWWVVLEDDARLCRGFERALELTLKATPKAAKLLWLHRYSGTVGRGRFDRLVAPVTQWQNPRVLKADGQFRHPLIPPWWWRGGTWGYAVHSSNAASILQWLAQSRTLDQLPHIDMAMTRMAKDLPVYGSTSVLVERGPDWRTSPHWGRRLRSEPWDAVDLLYQRVATHLSMAVHRRRRNRGLQNPRPSLPPL